MWIFFMFIFFIICRKRKCISIWYLWACPCPCACLYVCILGIFLKMFSILSGINIFLLIRSLSPYFKKHQKIFFLEFSHQKGCMNLTTVFIRHNTISHLSDWNDTSQLWFKRYSSLLVQHCVFSRAYSLAHSRVLIETIWLSNHIWMILWYFHFLGECMESMQLISSHVDIAAV